MKTRLVSTLALLLLIAGAAFADGPVRRTIVVKDGKIITDNIEGGELLGGKRGFIGVSLTELSPELREYFGAPKDSGVLIESVQNNGPADKAGLHVGDVVLSVDGKDVDSSVDVRRALRDKKEGDTVRIEIIRNHARQTVVASVEEKEAIKMIMPDELLSMPRIAEAGDGEWHGRIARLGDCSELQGRIKELETRLKELEKKLQK